MDSTISRRGLVAAASTLAAAGAAVSLAAPASPARADGAAAGSARPEPGTGHPTQISTPGADAEPIAPVEPPAVWDREADVVVVGTGIGGLTAALVCAQAGKSVIAVEKEGMTGEASRHACFNQINAGGTKLQDDYGFYWPTQTEQGTPLDGFDAKQAAAAFESHYQYSIEPKLLVRAVEQGAQWGDWLCEQDGVSLGCVGFALADTDFIDGKQNAIMGNDRTLTALTDDFTAAGGELLTSTPLTALVMDGGAVVGVQVEVDGRPQYFKAADGVVLCAGGFGYNLDMLEKYAPSAYMYALQGGPIQSHTVEVIRMGVGAGADISGYNSFCCWDGFMDEYWGDGDGEYNRYMWSDLTRSMLCAPWLRVDALGNRLPHYTDQDNYEGAPFNGNWEADMATTMASPDHRGRVILDANFRDTAAKLGTSLGYTEDQLSERAQLFMANIDFEQDWQSHLDRGAVKQADTLEELAPMIGMEPDDLVAAVDNWNRLCEQGEDDELPIAYKPEWLIPVIEPPFYGVVTGGMISKTVAGLRVNAKMQVLDTSHKVIEGLYAGWTTAGGICGENMFNGMWGKCSPFGSVAMSGVGGWMAAQGILGTFDE